MAAVAFMLFMVSGASAQFCLECSYQGAAGITAQQENQELTPASSGAQEWTQEFAPATPAQREGSDEMLPAGEAGMTGLQGTQENRGHELCSYCSLFKRGGFP